jgi:hypothetical protein
MRNYIGPRPAKSMPTNQVADFTPLHVPHMSDMHRRQSDALAEDRIIASYEQSKRNAEEWLRRANAAAHAAMWTLARNLFYKACDEVKHIGLAPNMLQSVPALYDHSYSPLSVTTWQEMLAEQGKL